MPAVWGAAFIHQCGDAPLTNPRRNACVGVRVLRHFYRKHHDWDLALRVYNGAL